MIQWPNKQVKILKEQGTTERRFEVIKNVFRLDKPETEKLSLVQHVGVVDK